MEDSLTTYRASSGPVPACQQGDYSSSQVPVTSGGHPLSSSAPQPVGSANEQLPPASSQPPSSSGGHPLAVSPPQPVGSANMQLPQVLDAKLCSSSGGHPLLSLRLNQSAVQTLSFLHVAQMVVTPLLRLLLN